MKNQTVVILDNIRSVHNVGSIFRTSDTLGIQKIYLVGTTPTPTDRFGRQRKDLAKVALGAEKNIPWEYESKVETLIEKLQKECFCIVALEQDSKSLDYKTVKFSGKTAVVVGNEVRGISSDILKKAHKIIEIPLLGKKESLNVSVAFAVAMFRILDN